MPIKAMNECSSNYVHTYHYLNGNYSYMDLPRDNIKKINSQICLMGKVLDKQ